MCSFGGKGEARGFIIQIASSSYEGRERTGVTDYLTGVDQKIPGWFTEITLLVKVRTAIRSEVNSRFGVMGCSTNDAISGLWFSL